MQTQGRFRCWLGRLLIRLLGLHWTVDQCQTLGIRVLGINLSYHRTARPQALPLDWRPAMDEEFMQVIPTKDRLTDDIVRELSRLGLLKKKGEE